MQIGPINAREHGIQNHQIHLHMYAEHSTFNIGTLSPAEALPFQLPGVCRGPAACPRAGRFPLLRCVPVVAGQDDNQHHKDRRQQQRPGIPREQTAQAAQGRWGSQACPVESGK